MKCRSCGAELPAGAMFCGECGFSVTVPRLVEPPRRDQASDTAVITPLTPGASMQRPAPRAPVHTPVQPTAAPTHTTAPADASPAHTPAQPARHIPAPAAPERAVPMPSLDWPPPAYPVPATARPTPRPPVVPGPVAPAAAVPPERAYRRFEDTRVVHSGAVDTEASERFVLQFSTGEGTTVFGSGLIGRNPVVQPGESFDQIVTITDPGKSVSKTHLEFGQTDGTFWVCDRFSGNGTVVRQPDERPQRLHPGRRHPVARGSRIDIAEQFFIVS